MKKIFFISGPGNLTDGEFKAYYKDAIDKEMKNGSSFVIGDYMGADKVSQEYLYNKNYKDVTVYHMCEKPRFNMGGFPTIGGFKSDKKRDEACTENSMFDIIFIRLHGLARTPLQDIYGYECNTPDYNSGGYKNLERRKLFNQRNQCINYGKGEGKPVLLYSLKNMKVINDPKKEINCDSEEFNGEASQRDH